MDLAPKALITGGAGFIGLNVAAQLLREGFDVTLVDDLSRGRRDAAVAQLIDEATLVEHDLTTPFPDELVNQRFTNVFHLAAMVGVRNVMRAPDEVLRVNLCSTLNLLEWCASNPPEAFFLSSTSELSDGFRELEGSDPVSEDAPFVVHKPQSPRASYAVSKLTCELLVAHYARRHGFRARIGRYYNVYGPRMGYDHVIPELMQRAHDHVDPFPVWAPDHSRAFCYIDDAVAATLELMRIDEPEPLLVNIGNDTEEILIDSLARRILEIADHHPTIEARPAPDGSPRRRCPDLRKLKQLTDLAPRVSLDEGLARTWDWYSADLDRVAAAGGSREAVR